MKRFFKLIGSKNILSLGNASFDAKLFSTFMGGHRLKIYIDGRWNYVVAYEHNGEYKHIKHLFSSNLHHLIGKKIYYHEEYLDKNYIKKLNDFKEKYEELSKNQGIQFKGRKSIMEEAMKELKLKETELKNTFHVKDVKISS